MLVVKPEDLEVGHHIVDESGIVWIVEWVGYGPQLSEGNRSVSLGLMREIVLTVECHYETR